MYTMKGTTRYMRNIPHYVCPALPYPIMLAFDDDDELAMTENVHSE